MGVKKSKDTNTSKNGEKVASEQLCRDCANGTWDTKFLNLDIFGNPTLISCQFERWKRVRNDKCCNGKYKMK